MSKVLFVNQLTGVSYAIDTEGNPATVADGVLSYFEANTAMNRLAEGYVQIPRDHYAIRLNLTSYGERQESLEIDGIVIQDVEGNPQYIKTYSDDYVDIHGETGDTFQVLLAKLNTETDVVSWAMNPLMTEAFTFSFIDAPKVDTHTPMETMLHLFRRQQLSTLEPTEVLLTVNIEI